MSTVERMIVQARGDLGRVWMKSEEEGQKLCCESVGLRIRLTVRATLLPLRVHGEKDNVLRPCLSSGLHEPCTPLHALFPFRVGRAGADQNARTPLRRGNESAEVVASARAVEKQSHSGKGVDGHRAGTGRALCEDQDMVFAACGEILDDCQPARADAVYDQDGLHDGGRDQH